MNLRRDMSRARDGRHRSLRGELRQLTILFSDLAGFTALSERCDPEDLNDIVDAFEWVCRDAVERCGGYLDSFHGDCALAFFGFPVMRGGEAEKAIRAAFSIREGVRALKLPSASSLDVHAGVATGATAIHLVEGVPRFMGDSINLAARLQHLARPGEILIGPATRELVAGMFELEPRGAPLLKGFSQPVPVWRVRTSADPPARPEPSRPVLEAPFVARRREMKLLLDLWAGVTRGSGRGLSIIGEPGIGKSRLVRHFLARVDASAHRVGIECAAHRTNAAFHPFVAYLQESAGVKWEDSAAVKLRSVRERMQLPENDETAAWLSRLLGIDAEPGIGDPGQLRQRIVGHLISHLKGLAETKPLILSVEDAQWIDPSSAELIFSLARDLETSPVFIVLTSRAHASLRKLDGVMEQVTLGRLTERQSAELVARLAGQGTLDRRRVGRIVARAQGVPLFVEELTRATASAVAKGGMGAEEAEGDLLPASVQESVLTRLDQLASAKPAAQIASILGQDFELRDLQQLLSEPPSAVRRALAALVRSGLIFPLDQGGRFAFHHAIVHDGAYRSLLRKDRRELHRRAAELLRRKDHAVVAFADLIAHHYAEAGVPEQAILFRIVAARHWLERSAHVEVVGHASEALKLVPLVQDKGMGRDFELTLELLRGAAFWALEGFSSVQVETAFSRANELAETIGDPVRRFVALRGLFGCYYGRGQLPRAFEQATRAIALANQTSSRAESCVGQLLAGQITLWRGQLLASRQHLEQALSLYHEEEQRALMLSSQIDPAVNAGIHLGWTLWTLGLPDTALRVTDEALSLARRIGQPFGLAMALFWIAVLRLWRGDRQRAAEYRLELHRVTSEHKIAYLAASAVVLDGEQAIAEGRVEPGVASILSGLAQFRQRRGRLGWPWAMSLIAEGYRKAGLCKEAMNAIDAGLVAARRNDERHWEAELHRLRGEIIMETEGAVPAAARAFGRSLRVARAQNAASLETRTLVSLARLKLLTGKTGDARKIARGARQNIREGFDTSDVRAVDDLLRGTAIDPDRS